jgi:hypothetical protein
MSNNKPSSSKGTKAMQIAIAVIFSIGIVFGALNFLADSSGGSNETSGGYESTTQTDSPF